MIPVSIILKNAVLDNTRVDDVRLTLFISSTITITIVRIVSDAKDEIVAIKNVLRSLFSLDLYAKIIEKNIIDKNIKNSTTTNIINKVMARITENSPDIIIDKNNFKVSRSVGEANIIISEITRVINPKSISISAVKNLELSSCVFVTGKVCVR